LSPLSVALVSVTTHVHNDTNASDRKAQNLREHLPSVAKDWPVVFDSPQILIAQIPDAPR